MPVDPDAEALFATKAEVAALKSSVDALTSNVTAAISELRAADAALKAADTALDVRLDLLENGGPVNPPVPPDPPKPPDPPPAAATFPGDVAKGQLRWGSAYGGNAEPGTRYGTPGRAVSRTYWDMTKVAGSVTRATSDVAKGQLPWVSYKLGTSWTNFANGTIDTAFKDLLTKLDKIGKPIWLTIHHEPEGSGKFGTDEGAPTDNSSINNWKNMQKKVRALMKSVGTKNIAFAPVLMAWTFDTRSGRVPASWIDGMDGVWDFFGIDSYAETGETLYNLANYKAFVADLTKRGYKIGLGEWGVRGDQISACKADFVKNNFVGVAYFDSGLNSTTGSWELTAQQLPSFNAICPTSPRV